MTRSYEIKQLNTAANQLGMAIGGFQAASALQVALEKPPPTIDIPGGKDAGKLIGVCDYRPRFGRFEVSYE